jgi:hypothetical protein
LLVGFITLLSPGGAPAVTLEQVISHEHPLLKASEAHLTVGRDADAPPRKWQVVRVDLWDVFRAPTRIRGLRLSAGGGSAAFDQIVLGRAEKDLPAIKK